MNGYLLLDRKRELKPVDGVVFDYDNRAGIYLNHYGIGGPGGEGRTARRKPIPTASARGLIIRDNYVFNTGRCAIGFCGDGVQCLPQRHPLRQGASGARPSPAATSATALRTNDNRAVEMRGWRWVVDGNDYEVYRNSASTALPDQRRRGPDARGPRQLDGQGQRADQQPRQRLSLDLPDRRHRRPAGRGQRHPH